MMWSWDRPAKRREWKLIVSGLLVYESMACLTSTAWCSSAKCGYLAPPLTPAPNISKWHFSDIAALANVRFAPEAAVHPRSLFLRSDNKRQRGHAGITPRGLRDCSLGPPEIPSRGT